LLYDYENVKTYLIVSFFLLSIVYSLFLGSLPARLRQVNAVLEKSDPRSTEGMSIFMQEKSKYIYVGSEKCASKCHNNDEMGFQYNIWKESPHSKSYLSLSSKKAIHYIQNTGLKVNPQENQVCLKCHITGGGLDSSFFAETYKKDDGVTCESCHKGEYNPKTFLPKEEDCLKCHENSVHKVHRFEFKKDCEKIVHSRPDTKTKGV
jgi:hypothetical protein